MEWISKLDFVQIANAIVILVVGLAAGLGFRSGKKAPTASSGSSVEVATDFFDSQAIKFLTTEVTGQAVAITGQAAAVKEQAQALREQTEAIKESTRAMRTLEKEIEEHRHEMSRRR